MIIKPVTAQAYQSIAILRQLRDDYYLLIAGGIISLAETKPLRFDMLFSITLRLRIAKVQAELKAQYNDQRFINEICQDYNAVNIIDFYFSDKNFRKKKDAVFLVVGLILAKAIHIRSIDDPHRAICYLLLRDRVDRINKDKWYASENNKFLSEYYLAIDAWENA